jgi:hypothetical protein
MLSLAESADGVSHRLESAAVSSADAAGAGFDFGVILRKKDKYPTRQWKNPLAVTVPNGGIQRDGLMPSDPST